MKSIKRNNQLLSNFVLAIIIFTSFGFLTNVEAQNVIKHDLSAVTTTAEHYTWDYYLSSTMKKVIEYFVVKDDMGTVKTAFNACDVCYNSHKGYKQVGNQMQCQNCGNKYLISKLGTSGTGGCWPGYIPNEIDGDEVVITEEDLIKGAYYFLVVSHTGIDKSESPGFSFFQNGNDLVLHMNSSADRTLHLIGLSGKIHHIEKSGSAHIRINTSKYQKGIYIVHLEENGVISNKKIFVY